MNDDFDAPQAERGAILPGLSIRGFPGLNLLQNRIALSGIAIAILLLISPPWDATAPNGMTGSIGHYFVFSSTPAEEYKYPGVDYGRLVLEIVGVSAITSVAVYLTRDATKR